MRGTIWYTETISALIQAERQLYLAKELIRQADGLDGKYGSYNMMLANVSEEIDELVEEAKQDQYPFTELDDRKFTDYVKYPFCEVCIELSLKPKKAKVQNHFINVCTEHSNGNRPDFYKIKSKLRSKRS